MSAVQDVDPSNDEASTCVDRPGQANEAVILAAGKSGREVRMRRQLLEQENARLANGTRRMLERWLARGKEVRRLRAVNALQARALRRVAHECRSPLHSIFGLTALLRRAPGELTSDQEQLVQMIQKSAESLLELLDDLTDPRRLDPAHLPLRPVQFEVAQLLGTLEAMLPPPLIKDGIRLKIDKPEDVPVVTSDPGKVLQILRNLINNSLKFTERGEVHVTAESDSIRNRLVFSVRDTGCGIPFEQQKKLADSKMARRDLAQGAPGGVGIPLCHALAEILGGRLSLNSAPGRGSTFSLVLPIRCEASLPDEHFSTGQAPAGRIDADVHEER